MAVAVTYPGVYVQEEPSGVRAVAGASTSIGLFIGRTRKGPIGRPVRLSNFTEFARVFSDDGTVSDTARYVRLFFLNGGADCYVMRIANDASRAEATLLSEDFGAGAQPVLTLRAKSAGASGEQIRARVWYAGEAPESRFNLEVFRWAPNPAGVLTRSETETYQNLSMNPDDRLYAPDFVTRESALVDAGDAGDPAADAQNGLSMAGRMIRFSNADTARAALGAAINGTAGQPGGSHFRLSLDGLPEVTVDLTALGGDIAGLAGTAAAILAEVATRIGAAVTDAYNAQTGTPGVTLDVGWENGSAIAGDSTRFLRLASQNNGEVRIRQATAGKDLTGPMMLGTAQGGLEIGAHAHRRPAPNGVTVSTATVARYLTLAFLQKQSVVSLTLPGFDAGGAPADRVIAAALAPGIDGTEPIVIDSYDPATSATGNSDGLRQRLAQLRDAVNADADANPRLNPWRAQLAGSRLTLINQAAGDVQVATFATAPTNLTATAGLVTRDVPRYSVGVGGIAGSQTPAAVAASDGDVPQTADYEDAFAVVDREVRLFNLMVLPPDRATDQDMQPLLGPASAFCRRRRAVLLVDPPAGARTVQQMSTQVNDVRLGIARDHAALYFPRLVVNENGRELAVGPAGAMAGLCARADGDRGVWKAPPGQDLPLFGVVGIERQLSDAENGILNPRGVNVIRNFPAGIVSWGARTLDGDDDFASEWKYLPVRRTALFIEESLYRGLQWVVFEPNGETLWAQIRLNVGAFMHGLYRRGAFKGEKKTDAYFVKCDGETTTQADIDLGIVNIWVGFAPLKPAEFVIIHLQQIAGQVEA